MIATAAKVCVVMHAGLPALGLLRSLAYLRLTLATKKCKEHLYNLYSVTSICLVYFAVCSGALKSMRTEKLQKRCLLGKSGSDSEPFRQHAVTQLY